MGRSDSSIAGADRERSDDARLLHGNLASELNELRLLVRERAPGCLGLIPVPKYEKPPDSAGEIVLAVRMAGLLGELSARGKPGDGALLTAAEVAAQLRVEPDAISAGLATGELPATNVGRGELRPRWRIAQSSLDAFLDRRASRPPAVATRRRRAASGPKVTAYF